MVRKGSSEVERFHWVGIRGVAKDRYGRIVLVRTEAGNTLDIHTVKELFKGKVYKFFVAGDPMGKEKTRLELIKTKDKKGYTLRTKANKTTVDNLDSLQEFPL